MLFEDIISISVILVYIIPAFLYVQSKNITHLYAIVGAFGACVLSETTKIYIIGDRNPRPIGAKNCDLWCCDGNQDGKPGMPSGHSVQVAFFAGYYFNQTNNLYIKVALILFPLAVMISRYTKHCHSIRQVIAGALLGFILSQIVLTWQRV
jgi:membrane-associated phospholipid phosphatase